MGSTGETVAINAFSQDRVSLVGGRIVRRRSAGGDFNNKMFLKTNQTLSGEKKDRNSKDTAAERPKLVRRRTWTKEDGEALFKSQQNVQTSGGYEVRQTIPEKWKPGQRAAVVRQSNNKISQGSIIDPLDFTPSPEYEFELPAAKAWAPGKRAEVVKRSDLKMKNAVEKTQSASLVTENVTAVQSTNKTRKGEKWMAGNKLEVNKKSEYVSEGKKIVAEVNVNEAGYEKQEKINWQKGEKMVGQVQHKDNLQTEGEFHGRSQQKWEPAEKVKVVKQKDNLKIEGKFETSKKQKEWVAGEKAAIVKKQDNLRIEGEFEGKEDEEWIAGERAEVALREDNLKIEGSFAKREEDQWQKGDRAAILRAQDTSQVEGEFQAERKLEFASAGQNEQRWIAGERVFKREDNLKVEGDFQKREYTLWAKGERADIMRREDNMVQEEKKT